MSFDLNDGSLLSGGSVVLNNGIAGKVENVKISVTKKQPGDNEQAPDYKLFATDQSGGAVNQGFYYHKDKDTNSAEKNKANEGYLISRILSAAKTLVPDDFVFPNVSDKTGKQIVDILFGIIKDNAEGKIVNIFTNYGTKTNPSQYMNFRYFDFIEKTTVEPFKSRLKANGNDLLEKLTADAPVATTTSATTTSAGW